MDEAKVSNGHSISELYENKDDGKFTLVLHPCDENPIVAANTAGVGTLRGTKEQFHELWVMLAVNFDFNEEDE